MRHFTPDEILAYARARVRNAEQRRCSLGTAGSAIIVSIGILVWMIHQRVEAEEPAFLAGPHFLAGVAFGILFVVFAAIGATYLVSALRLDRGLHHQTLKRLIELEEDRQAPPRTPP
jgi:hypothetical protein